MPSRPTSLDRSLRLALPATSANLGPAFDAAALALNFHLRLRAARAPDFTIKFHRGDLFAGTSDAAEAAQTKHLQRVPLVLDANLGAVIAALDAAERNSE